MNRRDFLYRSLAVGATSPVLLAAGENPAPNRRPDLEISIAVPIIDGRRRIQTTDENARFHVVLTNRSPGILRLWQEWCSWGYFNLTFDLLDEAGKVIQTIQKKPRGWRKNFPATWEVNSNRHLVLEVCFAQAWENVPVVPQGAQKPVVQTMRAVYQTVADQDTVQHNVWTGKVISSAAPYDFV